MAKSSNPKRKKVPKTVLKLPDLEQSTSAVLNSLVSSSSQRSYDHAIREFIEWYCSEPRLPTAWPTFRFSIGFGECIGDLAPMQNHQLSSSELTYF